MSKFTKEKYNYLQEQLSKLINSGKTIKQISKILNISLSTVSRLCNKINLHVPNYHN